MRQRPFRRSPLPHSPKPSRFAKLAKVQNQILKADPGVAVLGEALCTLLSLLLCLFFNLAGIVYGPGS